MKENSDISLVKDKENISQGSFTKHVSVDCNHSLARIQEFSKNQQKHYKRINWLYANNNNIEFCLIFNKLCATHFCISKIHDKFVCICRCVSTFFPPKSQFTSLPLSSSDTLWSPSHSLSLPIGSQGIPLLLWILDAGIRGCWLQCLRWSILFLLLTDSAFMAVELALG